MEDLRREDYAASEERPMNVAKLICFRRLRLQVFSVIVLTFGQHLTGINVVSPKRFAGRKLGKTRTLGLL